MLDQFAYCRQQETLRLSHDREHLFVHPPALPCFILNAFILTLPLAPSSPFRLQCRAHRHRHILSVTCNGSRKCATDCRESPAGPARRRARRSRCIVRRRQAASSKGSPGRSAGTSSQEQPPRPPAPVAKETARPPPSPPPQPDLSLSADFPGMEQEDELEKIMWSRRTLILIMVRTVHFGIFTVRRYTT